MSYVTPYARSDAPDCCTAPKCMYRWITGMHIETLPRRYFTVLDEAGRPAPAVEYWAASLDGAEPAYEALPLRRFVKLLGSGECLEKVEEGVFIASISRRAFFPMPSA